MAINKIMVLGAGTMGMGIAQVFAEAGKTVLVECPDVLPVAFLETVEQQPIVQHVPANDFILQNA